MSCCPGSHRDLLLKLGPEDLVLLTLGLVLLLRLFHPVILGFCEGVGRLSVCHFEGSRRNNS